LGKPEATLMLDPAAAAGTVTPPTGVAVTVSTEVARDCMVTFVGEIANVTPGADCTCTVTLLLATIPLPAAVTVTVADDAGAEADANNVRVTEFELTLFAGVIWF
jgi:hypothetical protein